MMKPKLLTEQFIRTLYTQGPDAMVFNLRERGLIAEQEEREGPPVEFDPRALRAVLCGLACFWIVALALVAWWFDLSVWTWICRRF